VVIAWFERDIERGAAHVGTARVRIAQRFNFRVRLAAPVMPPLAERHTVAHQHRADGRIRRRIGNRARCKFARAREIDVVGLNA
jgi:hypothetical protein